MMKKIFISIVMFLLIFIYFNYSKLKEFNSFLNSYKFIKNKREEIIKKLHLKEGNNYIKTEGVSEIDFNKLEELLIFTDSIPMNNIYLKIYINDKYSFKLNMEN